MQYQKIINLLDATTNQPSKFRTRNWVEINDESQGDYNDDDHDDDHDDNNNNNNNNNNNDNNNNINNNNIIKCETTMIRSSLCDYSDAYIVVIGIITLPNTAAASAAVYSTNKNVLFKNCSPFISCITEINNAQVDLI